jgi:tetratricopeptide (TPR) repeat protein
MQVKGLLVIWCALLLLACNPSGQLVKLGNTKRDAGLYEDASVYYYNALLRNPKDVKAKEGLAVTAQQVLNDKFQTFNKLVVENNVDEAMKVYQNAEKYNKNAASVGVTLRWPNEYDEVYADIRAEYISKQYDEALLLMNNKEYERAERIFEKISTLDSTYRGITVLRINTILEPLYTHGLQEMDQGKYKQAYQTFSKIVQQDETYKDAKQLKDEANQKATTSLAVFPVYYLESDSLLQSIDLSNMIQSRLQQKKYDYIQLESADVTKQTLQSRGWDIIPDATKAIEAGRTIGIKYVVWVMIESVSYKESLATTEKKFAYEAFSENILNPYTGTYSAITKFQKVSYDDTYEKRMITVRYKYALVNAIDGKTVLSEQKEHTQKDEIHQFVFEGNINNLYEELPTGNYLPSPNLDWRELFANSKRNPLSRNQLVAETQFVIAKQVAQSVMGVLR